MERYTGHGRNPSIKEDLSMNSHNQDTGPDGVSTPYPGSVAVSLHPPPRGVREALAAPGGADLPSLVPDKTENGVVMLYLCPLLSGAEGAHSLRRNGHRASAVGAAWPRLEAGRGKHVTDENEAAVVRLTATEIHVMRLLAEGKTNRAIAREMFISINTVKTHVRAIFQKLGVNTRGCAVTRAIVTGLIDWPGLPGT
jgi:DNA-binding CsgD family transcriptional regulator